MEGSDGREGKYFEWRAERKLGSEGSRSGGFGASGKCIFGGGDSRGVWEAGWRSGGGCTGGASGSEANGEFADLVLRNGSCCVSDSSNLTLFGDACADACSSSQDWSSSSFVSFPPSSIFAFLSSLSMSDGLSTPMSSFLASSISSSDIWASRCLFSCSIEGSFDLPGAPTCRPFAVDPFTLQLASCERGGDAILVSVCLCIWLDSLG